MTALAGGFLAAFFAAVLAGAFAGAASAPAPPSASASAGGSAWGAGLGGAFLAGVFLGGFLGRSGSGGDLPGGVGTVGEQHREPGLVEDRHPELHRLVVLGARGSRRPPRRRSSSTPSRLTLPPRAWIASLASSREKPSSEPVTTIVSPRAVAGPSSAPSSAIRTPAAAHLLDDRRGASRPSNHSTHGLGDRRADPSTAASSSSRRPTGSRRATANSRASARAAVGPTCRIDSADQHPPQRLVLGRVEVGQQLRAVGATSPPSLLGGTARPCSSVASSRSKRSPSSADRPRRRAARPPPRSRAPRCRTRPGRRRGTPARAAGPGRTAVLGQRMSASPSFAGRQRRAALRAARRHHELALGAVAQVDDRADDLGDDVAGLAQHDRVADQHALAAAPRTRCAASPCSTVEPATTHRLHHAERRDPAGAADVDLDVEQLGRRPPRAGT